MLRCRRAPATQRYDVLVGDGVLGGARRSRWLRCAGGGHVVVVSDENVAPLYLETVQRVLRAAGFEVSQVVIPAGERQKTLARAEELYGVLYDRHLSRPDALVALGGGVDRRPDGLRGGHVPARRGARAGADDAPGAGRCGAGRQGRRRLSRRQEPRRAPSTSRAWWSADLDTLATLPERELRSGLAEVAKYALLVGGELLRAIDACLLPARGARRPSESSPAVRSTSSTWWPRDEREESGERAVLNLGHTIGHAIEAAGGFGRFTHGEAVALGLRATLWLSERLTGLPAASTSRAARSC